MIAHIRLAHGLTQNENSRINQVLLKVQARGQVMEDLLASKEVLGQDLSLGNSLDNKVGMGIRIKEEARDRTHLQTLLPLMM
jgi:hypothetical protein